MALTWTVRDREIVVDRPVVMGILNVTPDSFSDGGLHYAAERAVERALEMIAEGADIVDVGGESTRPQGATAVSAQEEIDRVIPVIEGIARSAPEAVLSVDTVKHDVAAAAIAAGVHIVNDVSAFRLDERMPALCAEHGVGVVLMHSRGDVSSMATYEHARYANTVDEVLAELGRQVAVAESAGVTRDHIAVDPGIGFSKHSAESLQMLACLERVVAWGLPVLVGASRKRFIGELTGRKTPRERVFGSVGAAVSAYDRGARIFRVHDVVATREALDVAAAIRAAGAA